MLCVQHWSCRIDMAGENGARKPHGVSILICGARARHGGRCVKPALPGKRRCKWHGGLSTGWRHAGVRNTAASLGIIHARQRLWRSLGIPWPSRRRSVEEVRNLAEEAKAVLEPLVIGFEAMEAEGKVPAKAIAELTPAELLSQGTGRGLQQVIAIIGQPLTRDADGKLCDLKQQRLIGDLALGMTRLFVRAAESEFRARHDDVLDKLLAMIEAEKVKKEG